MKVIKGIAGLFLLSFMILFPATLPTIFILEATQPVKEARNHLRKACEIVWKDANSYQIARCVNRTTAALDDTNRLRDNELKRLLIKVEEDLAECREKLEKLKK